MTFLDSNPRVNDRKEQLVLFRMRHEQAVELCILIVTGVLLLCKAVFEDELGLGLVLHVSFLKFCTNHYLSSIFCEFQSV
jgi:hypothetical protein